MATPLDDVRFGIESAQYWVRFAKTHSGRLGANDITPWFAEVDRQLASALRHVEWLRTSTSTTAQSAAPNADPAGMSASTLKTGSSRPDTTTG